MYLQWNFCIHYNEMYIYCYVGFPGGSVVKNPAVQEMCTGDMGLIPGSGSFLSGCTNLHPHQQCTGVPFSLHPHQPLLFLLFLIISILTGVRWHLTVVLISISLMVNDVEQLFMCRVGICISFLEKGVLRCLARFLKMIFNFLIYF